MSQERTSTSTLRAITPPPQDRQEEDQYEQSPVTRPFSPHGPTRNPNFSLLPPLNTTAPQPVASPRRNTPRSQASPVQPRTAASAATLPSRSIPHTPLPPVPPSNKSSTLIRDFAYTQDHILHYGPLPEPPPSEAPKERISSRRKEGWRGQPGQAEDSPTTLDLSGTGPTFGDGPPWKEDEDLLSPIVRTTKHKKSRSTLSDLDRGRHDERSSSRRKKPEMDTSAAEQPGVAEYLDTDTSYTPSSSYFHSTHRHQHDTRQPNLDASASYPPRSPMPLSDDSAHASDADDDDDEAEDESRYSRDYQFHIASPDEEMHGKAVALFDFAKENENELPLLEGQVLWVSYRHGQGWLVAQDPKTGENGLVPEEYVRMLRDIEGGLSGLNGGLAGLSPGSVGESEAEGSVGLASPEELEVQLQAQAQAQAQSQSQQAHAQTPTSATADPPSAFTSMPLSTTSTTPHSPQHDRTTSTTSATSEHSHYTPTLSHFTTSSKDLEPYAGPPIEKSGVSPRIPQHSPTRSPVRNFLRREPGSVGGLGLVSPVDRHSGGKGERDAWASGVEGSGAKQGGGLQGGDEEDEEDEDEPMILEDAVAREIRRSQGPGAAMSG